MGVRNTAAGRRRPWKGEGKKNVCSCSSHVVKFEKVVRAERTNNAHDESLLPCVLRVVVWICSAGFAQARKLGL